MAFSVVFLYLIAGVFVIDFPLISMVRFLIAGTIAMATGLSSELADLAIWGFVAPILTAMSDFGYRK